MHCTFTLFIHIFSVLWAPAYHRCVLFPVLRSTCSARTCLSSMFVVACLQVYLFCALLLAVHVCCFLFSGLPVLRAPACRPPLLFLVCRSTCSARTCLSSTFVVSCLQVYLFCALLLVVHLCCFLFAGLSVLCAPAGRPCLLFPVLGLSVLRAPACSLFLLLPTGRDCQRPAHEGSRCFSRCVSL